MEVGELYEEYAMGLGCTLYILYEESIYAG